MRRIGVFALAVILAATGTVSAGATEPADRHGDAESVQAIHDTLKGAAAAGDVLTARSTLAELAPLLTSMASGERYELPPTSRDLVAAARDATAEAQSDLSRPFPVRADIPSLLSELLTQLLKVLMELVQNLLGPGMLPVPAPVPAP